MHRGSQDWPARREVEGCLRYSVIVRRRHPKNVDDYATPTIVNYRMRVRKSDRLSVKQQPVIFVFQISIHVHLTRQIIFFNLI